VNLRRLGACLALIFVLTLPLASQDKQQPESKKQEPPVEKTKKNEKKAPPDKSATPEEKKGVPTADTFSGLDLHDLKTSHGIGLTLHTFDRTVTRNERCRFAVPDQCIIRDAGCHCGFKLKV